MNPVRTQETFKDYLTSEHNIDVQMLLNNRKLSGF